MEKRNKRPLFVFITDIHLNKNNGELIKSLFHQLVELCDRRGVSTVVCGGDVFTSRSGQPLQCLIDWQECLEILAARDIKIYMIPGNHDKTDPDSDASYLDVYAGNKNVTLYKRAACKCIGGTVIGFIPYFGTERWISELEELNNCIAETMGNHYEHRVLVTHVGFDGVKNNDGSEVESAIKPSLMKDWDKTLVGHYHDASVLTDNVIYTGSLYQNNFGEDIADKGFTIVYNDCSLEHVQSKFPRYIKEVIQATDRETLRNVIDKHRNSVDNVRIVFTGKKEECQRINAAEIQSKFGIDCKFLPEENAVAVDMDAEEIVTEFNSGSILKEFDDFCEENGITGDKYEYAIQLFKDKMLCGI